MLYIYIYPFIIVVSGGYDQKKKKQHINGSFIIFTFYLLPISIFFVFIDHLSNPEAVGLLTRREIF